MADSIEQKIIDEIVARMETILTANGYTTSIGTTVEDSRPNWQQEDLPAMSVFQGPVTAAAEQPGNRRSTVRIMPVRILASFETGDTAAVTAAYARNVLKDIHKAIKGTGVQATGYLAERWPVVDGTPPGLAMETRERSHGIEYAAENQYEITGCFVEIEVVYVSGKFNLES